MSVTLTLYDKYCEEITTETPNAIVAWYLMSSWAYYKEDDPIISDALYDNLSRRLIDNWDSIKHQHKDRIDLDALKAGTFLGEYPSIIEGAVAVLRRTKQ